MPRDGSLVLSDVRATTLEMACKRCGRFGRFNVKQLIGVHGADAKLTDLLPTLANCRKAGSFSIHDRCQARFERYEWWGLRPVKEIMLGEASGRF